MVPDRNGKEEVNCKIEDEVAIVTLNRPEVMNALNMQLLKRLTQVMQELEADERVRVVVLTGAGEKAFCGGADLKERRGMSEKEVGRYRHLLQKMVREIRTFSKPIIAAVNGLALGGGSEIALLADIRLASHKATFGLPEVRLAIIPGAGGTQMLPRIIGRAKAKEMILTGEPIDAEEARKIGLVSAVYPQEELLAKAMDMAKRIGQNGPVALRQAKRAIDFGSEADFWTGMTIEEECYRACIHTQDRQEGLIAFQEKRKPKYKGE